MFVLSDFGFDGFGVPVAGGGASAAAEPGDSVSFDSGFAGSVEPEDSVSDSAAGVASEVLAAPVSAADAADGVRPKRKSHHKRKAVAGGGVNAALVRRVLDASAWVDGDARRGDAVRSVLGLKLAEPADVVAAVLDSGSRRVWDSLAAVVSELDAEDASVRLMDVALRLGGDRDLGKRLFALLSAASPESGVKRSGDARRDAVALCDAWPSVVGGAELIRLP